jgi:Flp pilus assembly pilin Flp
VDGLIQIEFLVNLINSSVRGVVKLREPARREAGQGLVEYALLLILVGMVVILALAVFGDRVQKLYCKSVWSIDPNIDAPYCQIMETTCQIQTSQPFRLEAVVTDRAGDDNVTKVEFYVDDHLYNTERDYRFCLESGNGSLCQIYTGPIGPHEFTAVAYDADGNTASCSVKANVQ